MCTDVGVHMRIDVRGRVCRHRQLLVLCHIHAIDVFVEMRIDMRRATRVEMRIDMCMEMCMEMCMDMHLDMCVDMCIDMCIATRVDMCMEMCIQMCMNMCTEMCMDIGMNMHLDMCTDMRIEMFTDLFIIASYYHLLAELHRRDRVLGPHLRRLVEHQQVEPCVRAVQVLRHRHRAHQEARAQPLHQLRRRRVLEQPTERHEPSLLLCLLLEQACGRSIL